MIRRHFLGAASALAILATVAGVPAAQAQETLTGVTYIPPSYEDLAYGYQGFVEAVNKADPDVLQLDFYDSGRLLKADEQLPALRSGNIDLMFHTTSYVTRSLPILGILGLPGVVEALYENPDRLKRGSPLFELIAGELEKQDLKLLTLGGGIFEPEYIWSTANAPVTSIDDINGKKVRVVSYEATDVIEDFGGAAVRVPSSELYLALQRGTVDAAVATISTINGRDLNEQTANVYRLPLTAFAIGIFMRKDRYDALSDEEKAALDAGVEWFDAESVKAANEEYFAKQYWPAFKEAGLSEYQADEAAMQKLDEVSEDVREEWIGQVGDEVGRRAIALALGKES
ncbi:TRAP transporter substrate-binding protein [Acuticoccus sediminis]|uniref:TRAP transporter substrate-binding protein n=1 Tax=Acuticoccus sediminis TaxID=2184697 RepID=UPI001CFEE102|nr:TRAP transporter substrate-binding protein DctP [Acuticoccus sediminis]